MRAATAVDRVPYFAAKASTADTRSSSTTFDIVLSSGGCAFGAHCGFLEAVESSFSRKRVGAVVGTSSGALAGERTLQHRAMSSTNAVCNTRTLTGTVEVPI